LNHQRNGILLSIVDDGCGFNYDEVREKGLGLISMQERVQAIKGRLVITSNLGDGTKIEVHTAWKE
jgi:signal transduction histidine kinase